MKHIHPEKTIFIVNPKSGGGKALKKWDRTRDILTNMGINFDQALTEGQGHAMNLAEEAARNEFQKIIAVGGDGTAHEVVNGIINADIPTDKVMFGLLPFGTGNDWRKTSMVPKNFNEAINVVLRNKTAHQDIGKITYFDGSEKKTRYFINIVGGGYDAFVGKFIDGEREKGKYGMMVYLEGMIKCLGKFKAIPVKITTELGEKETELFSFAAGICKYNAGGMQPCPNAISDDGLMDFTIFKKISKLKLILNTHRMFTGSILKLKEVDYEQGKRIKVDGPENLWIEADGEFLGSAPFEIEIIPSRLQYLRG